MPFRIQRSKSPGHARAPQASRPGWFARVRNAVQGRPAAPAQLQGRCGPDDPPHWRVARSWQPAAEVPPSTQQVSENWHAEQTKKHWFNDFSRSIGERSDLFKTALDMYPDFLNATLPDGDTALIKAVHKRDLDAVHALLAYDELDLTAHGTHHSTALHLAAARGDESMVSALLSHSGAAKAVACTDRWGVTPISRAAQFGHTHVVDALRPHSPEAPMAVELKLRSRTRAQVFVGPQLDVPKVKAANDTVCRFNISAPQLGCWEEMVKFVSEHGEPAGRWLIHSHGTRDGELGITEKDAVSTVDLIRLLVQSGARDIDIWSCFASAPAETLLRIIRDDPLWPKFGTRLNVTFHGDDGRENVRWTNNLEIADKLGQFMSLRLDSSLVVDVNRKTVITFDPAAGEPELYTLSPASFEAIHNRIFALSKGYDRNRFALHFMLDCCIAGRIDLLKQSIGSFPGAVLELNSPMNPDTNDESLFEAAAYFGYVDAMAVLLSEGAARLQNAKTGASALQSAAQGGHLAAVRFLLEHPATTPAHVANALASATERNRPEVVKALTEWRPRQPASVRSDVLPHSG